MCALLLPACHRETPAAATTPIILISVDTLRADRLPAYGSTRIATPALDRLAADGVVFENAYSHVPLTFPSHAAMLTGTLPWQNGVRSNIGYHLDASRPSLPALLAAQGYATGAAVSAYVLRGETGLASLFDHYDDAIEVHDAATIGMLQRSGDATSAAALRWIDTVRGRPFFLFLHLFEPHTPYEPVEPFRSRYADPYDGEIATADAIVGRFLRELEARGLYDDALIVLVSDHGEGLGDHGEAEHGVLLYREALHVPLILKLPHARLAGTRVSEPAQVIDILPTLTSAAGAKTPDGLAGTSLIDLAGKHAPRNRAIYAETLYPRLHLGWSQLRSLIDDRHHFIESPEPELFDVAADPRETHNLREKSRREAHALAQRLEAVPLNLTKPGDADPEERARLAALGYLSAAAPERQGPLRNPKDHIGVLARIQQTFVLNREGRYRESVDLCRAILREDPDLVDVYTQLAGDLRHLGRLDEAVDAYREAIRRSPQLIDSFAVEIAKLELDRGNLEAAELNARQALALHPVDAHLLLAGVAFERRDWTGAERDARLALGGEAHPRVPALIMLARVLIEQGRLPEARVEIDRAAARVRDGGSAPVATLESTRGDVLARMGENANAETAFRNEIAHFPTTRQAYIRLAILLASQHRFAEIEPTLEAMVQASPVPATYRLAAETMSDLGNDEGARAFNKRGEARAAELRRRTNHPSGSS